MLKRPGTFHTLIWQGVHPGVAIRRASRPSNGWTAMSNPFYDDEAVRLAAFTDFVFIGKSQITACCDPHVSDCSS
jgi:hypothetical protein